VLTYHIILVARRE